MRLDIGVFSLAAMALMLAACGGSGGGGGGSGAPPPPSTYTGVFIDAPTQGLGYTASPSGLTGTTGAGGTFSFKAGDTVTFSLAVGQGSPILVGSWQPATPSGGSNGVVFVLWLNNGVQVAQVLQSLNIGTASALNVGGLTLSAASATALNNYIASGGTALPAGVATGQALLAAAQASATVGGSAPTFVVPGGASTSQTLAALQNSLSGLTAASGISVGTWLPGRVAFYQGSKTKSGGAAGSDVGIIEFQTNSTISIVTANNTIGVQTGGAWAVGSAPNIFTLNTGKTTYTVTLSYTDTIQGLYSSTATDGSTGAGSYAALQASFAPGVIAGKTLTIVGSLGGCGSVPFQVVVDSAGASFSANCEGAAAGSSGTGTIAASAIPGVLTFTTTGTGLAHYVGLVGGGTITAGSLAVVEESTATSPANGIFGVTAK